MLIAVDTMMKVITKVKMYVSIPLLSACQGLFGTPTWGNTRKNMKKINMMRIMPPVKDMTTASTVLILLC